jgi:hypothetical protein
MILAERRSRSIPAAPTTPAPPTIPAPPTPIVGGGDRGEIHRGARPPGRTGLGGVLGLVGVGLLIQAVGEHLGRAGRVGDAQICLVVGIALIYIPCAWRLISASTPDRERGRTVVVLGLSLVISAYLLNPLLFTSFDELLHQTTLWQIQYHHGLFTSNTELPVSPYYPGLELVTVGIRDGTGLPNVVAELIVIGLARLMLVLSLFRIVQRGTHSARAGGVAVLVYAASPQFYGFNAAYSYQTLALAFAAVAACLLLAAVDAPTPRIDRRVILAEIAVAATIVTHHLVGLIAVVLLVFGALVARWVTSRAAARVLAHAAIVGVVLIAVWTSISAGKVIPYLRPILVGAVDGFMNVLRHHRHVLSSTSGIPTPHWQSALIVASVGIVFVAIVAATVTVVRHPTAKRRRLRYLAPLVAVAYPLDLATALSPAASDVGQRASTFLFLAIAILLAVAVPAHTSRRAARCAAALATCAFLGSVILGAGPLWNEVPGPFVPTADQRGIDNASLAAGRWAADHLPVGATIAADRDNGVVMSAVGHLAPVTAFSGGVNVGPIYFDPIFGRYDESLIRRAHIRYLLVDTRLVSGPPVFGSYFEPGETQGRDRLTSEELAKFATVPGLRRIYDNGPITIYDLGAILGVPTTVPSAHSTLPPVPTNPGVVIVLGAVAVIWRRRWRWRTGDLETGEQAVAWLFTATAAAGVVGLIVVLTHLSPVVVELALFVAAAAGVADAMARSPAGAERPAHRSKAVTLGAFGVLAVAVAVTVSAASARTEWRSTPSISTIEHPNGVTVATATLGPDAPVDATVALAGPTGLLWQSVPLPPSGTSVTLPLTTYPSATAVELVVGGHPIRSVTS